MPLLSSTKKAEQFAKLLDGSASSGSGELSTLQGLATRLSSVPQPRAEFASALRDRLMSEAATTLPGAAGGAAGTGAGAGGVGGSGTGSSGTGASGGGAGSAATSAVSTTASSAASSATAGGAAAGGSAFSSVLSATAPLWTQLAAGAAAVTIAVTGVGIGASRALPGDLLYGVKRQVESIQLDLAGSPTDKALARLGFAHTRLAEISDLLDGRQAGAPLSADMQKQISTLLHDWAAETSSGTTALLAQLSAGQGDVAAIRGQLVSFTDSQARTLALVVQRLPDATLESLTGSAFAYLQRVDTALGNPVNLATLLPSLGLAIPTTTDSAPSSTTPSTKAPTTPGTPSTGSGPTTNTPSSVPTLPIPTGGRAVPRGTTPGLPTTPSVPSLPSTGGTGSLPGKVGGAVGGVGGAVNGSVSGATSGATKTVDGVLQGVTGNGPGLPLPTAVPTVPKLGK